LKAAALLVVVAAGGGARAGQHAVVRQEAKGKPDAGWERYAAVRNRSLCAARGAAGSRRCPSSGCSG